MRKPTTVNAIVADIERRRTRLNREIRRRPLIEQIKATGCMWDARERGLRGEAALSAALSCHVSHGHMDRRGLTKVY